MQCSLWDAQVHSQQQSLNYLRIYPAFTETETVTKFIRAINGSHIQKMNACWIWGSHNCEHEK
jgi:hypothetical protein